MAIWKRSEKGEEAFGKEEKKHAPNVREAEAAKPRKKEIGRKGKGGVRESRKLERTKSSRE